MSVGADIANGMAQGFTACALVGNECLRFNPITGEVASRVTAMRAPQARLMAQNAARSFGPWSQTPPTQRHEILHRAADLFELHRVELCALMRAETAISQQWQSFNIEMAIRHLRAAADIIPQLNSDLSKQINGGSVSYRVPVGVCLGIAPWNAPLVLGVRAVATALACGNSVVLKASELCPGSHLMIGRIFAEAGLPDGVLSIVTHAPEHAEEIVTALIESDVVRRVNFTGSTRVGRIVAQIAARQLKRCLLELGGKAPLLVLEDADLDAAADAVAYGGFLNQGQVCMSTDRVIVMDSVADAFVAKLKQRALGLKASAAENAVLGPVVCEVSARRLQTLIHDALNKGASLMCGGKVDGVFLDATVIDHITPGMTLYSEESFGPIVAICRASSLDEAITIANDTRYGLAAAIFSQDIEQALTLANRIESGICHINTTTLFDDPDMPVGGVKDSGYGRFGGNSALDEFTEWRWLNVAAPPDHKTVKSLNGKEPLGQS